MSEIRYNTNHIYPEGLEAKDRVLANAIIKKIPYEVSDNELADEAAEKTVAELSALTDSALKVPQVGKFLKALARLRR